MVGTKLDLMAYEKFGTSITTDIYDNWLGTLMNQTRLRQINDIAEQLGADQLYLVCTNIIILNFF